MSTPFQVSLVAPTPNTAEAPAGEVKAIEIDAADAPGAMRAAEDANPGFTATGASTLLNTFAVTLLHPSDGAVTARVVARDVMDAKRLSEEQHPGFEMSACTEQ